MLETGDILICRGKSWLSKAIMKVTKSKYSHTASVIKVGDKTLIVEAQSRGINIKTFKTWINKWDYEYEVYRFNKIFNEEKVLVKSLHYCGETKYDKGTFIFRIPFRLIFKKHRVKRSKEKQNKKFICSELTAWIWGISIKGTHEITPQELFKYLKDSKDWDNIHV